MTHLPRKMVRPLLDWMENPFVDLPLWSLSISHLLDVDNIMTSHEKTLAESFSLAFLSCSSFYEI